MPDISQAANNHDLDQVRECIRQGQSPKQTTQGLFDDTPLILAARYDHSEIVEYLITEANAHIEQANLDGVTPLCQAIISAKEPRSGHY